MSVKIYVEGGGDDKSLKRKLREGFKAFFQNAKLSGRLPAVVPCGSRNAAFDRFKTSVRANKTGVTPMLLVDSEGPVSKGQNPWQHLRRDNWDKPDGTTEDHVHLMVECMESWFLGDKDAVAKYYGKNFKSKVLSSNAHPEQVDKDKVLAGLKNATRNTTKGAYSKGKHSFDILAAIDPAAVRRECPHAERLLRTLERIPE